MNAERLLDRFLQYVRIDTMADEKATSYPSSPGQWTLGKLLVDQLHQMGLPNARQDENGLVHAVIESNAGPDVPVVAFNSHLDTSPETSGANVNPQVIRDYQGGDLVLPGDPDQVITEADSPTLCDLHGATLITSDGTTLLGGDDKAGLAIIMEVAHQLMENSDIQHGPVRILFTCDEEIGRGVSHVNVEGLGATACYTLDGGGAGEIDVETFSADLAVITVQGVNIHPAIAKDRMVNALRAVGLFLAKMPSEMSPEKTSEREGFMHPYQLEGGVAEARLRVILRDFETAKLEDQAAQLRQIAAEVVEQVEGVKIDIDVQPQYRNMADGLQAEPRAVDYAVQAHERLGLACRHTIVRGGTDGSQLTECGLPTPNLSSGQHNLHSPLEWACLDEMVQAGRVCIEILRIWAENSR